MPIIQQQQCSKQHCKEAQFPCSAPTAAFILLTVHGQVPPNRRQHSNAATVQPSFFSRLFLHLLSSQQMQQPAPLLQGFSALQKQREYERIQAIMRRPVVSPADAAFTMPEEAVSDFF
jgi:hypothetical protein